MIECFKKIFSKVLFVVLCSVTSMSICAQESLITVKRENKYFMGKA